MKFNKSDAFWEIYLSLRFQMFVCFFHSEFVLTTFVAQGGRISQNALPVLNFFEWHFTKFFFLWDSSVICSLDPLPTKSHWTVERRGE